MLTVISLSVIGYSQDNSSTDIITRNIYPYENHIIGTFRFWGLSEFNINFNASLNCKEQYKLFESDSIKTFNFFKDKPLESIVLYEYDQITNFKMKHIHFSKKSDSDSNYYKVELIYKSKPHAYNVIFYETTLSINPKWFGQDTILITLLQITYKSQDRINPKQLKSNKYSSTKKAEIDKTLRLIIKRPTLQTPDDPLLVPDSTDNSQSFHLKKLYPNKDLYVNIATNEYKHRDKYYYNMYFKDSPDSSIGSGKGQTAVKICGSILCNKNLGRILVFDVKYNGENYPFEYVNEKGDTLTGKSIWKYLITAPHIENDLKMHHNWSDSPKNASEQIITAENKPTFHFDFEPTTNPAINYPASFPCFIEVEEITSIPADFFDDVPLNEKYSLSSSKNNITLNPSDKYFYDTMKSSTNRVNSSEFVTVTLKIKDQFGQIFEKTFYTKIIK